MKLTRAQRAFLEEAARNDGRVTWGVKRSAGGAIRRMCNRLELAGLIAGPPHRITAAGRKAIAKKGEA